MTASLPDAATPVAQARPFLKWAGGKGQLVETYSRYFPAAYGAYLEPFLGGGAVFFSLRPPRAILSDANDELVDTYKVVKHAAEELIRSLRKHENDHDYYYAIRALDPAALPSVERASRFIYLNRTCYNGLYRVNRKGRFNVPFGSYKNPRICDEEGLRAASAALRGAVLKCGDFEEVSALAKPDDFVYLDPPYDPVSQTASFTSYFREAFTEEEQRRLAETYRRLDRRGCLLMLSNSDTPLVRDLYSGFNLVSLEARRAINCKSDRRGPVPELLILNYHTSAACQDT
jgi:DNA adenine methylase